MTALAVVSTPGAVPEFPYGSERPPRPLWPLDAHFQIKEGQFLCENCGRHMDDHGRFEGEGEFAGWVRYRCA